MAFSVFRTGIIMVCGVLITCALSLKLALISALCLGLLSLMYFAIKRQVDLGPLIYILAFVLACLSYTYSVSDASHPSLRYKNRYVTITGEITTPAEASATTDNLRYNLRLHTIENIRGRIDANETIALTTPATLQPGDRVTVKGIIKGFRGEVNEYGFNQDKFYKSRNIFTRIYTEDITVTENKPSLFSFGGRMMATIDRIIYNHYQGDGAAMLSATLTGNRTHFSPEYRATIQNTGFSRILHPAYVHIWVITLFMGCMSLFSGRKFTDTLTLVILVAYAMAQCGNYGFVRCLLCSAIMIFFRMSLGNNHYPTTLASYFILLVVSFPTMVFNPSIILSSTGGLLVYAFREPIARRLTLIPQKLRSPVAITLIGTFLFTPFSMFYFNSVCIYTLLLPFLIAPVTALLLILAPIGLLLMELFGDAYIIKGYMNVIIDFIYNVPIVIEGLPFSSINLNTPSIGFIVTYGWMLYLAFLTWCKDGRHRFYHFAIASGLALSLVITSVINMGTLNLSFVNVGQGDGALIHRKGGEAIIIDGGGSYPESSYNVGEAIFLPYLEARGINHIEVAVVSHYHQDHVEGIIATLESIKTDTIVMPKIESYYDTTTMEWAQILWATALSCGTKVHFVEKDTQIRFNSGLTLNIYTPHKDFGRVDINDTSLVTEVKYGRFTALFTGDMTQRSEEYFISHHNVDCDVLKVAHHGSGDSSSESFIQAVKPETSIISVGEGNLYKLPHPDTLKRLKGTTCLRTDDSRDITISARKSGNYRIR